MVVIKLSLVRCYYKTNIRFVAFGAVRRDTRGGRRRRGRERMKNAENKNEMDVIWN